MCADNSIAVASYAVAKTGKPPYMHICCLLPQSCNDDCMTFLSSLQSHCLVMLFEYKLPEIVWECTTCDCMTAPRVTA